MNIIIIRRVLEYGDEGARDSAVLDGPRGTSEEAWLTAGDMAATSLGVSRGWSEQS